MQPRASNFTSLGQLARTAMLPGTQNSRAEGSRNRRQGGTGHPGQQGCAKVPHRCTWCDQGLRKRRLGVRGSNCPSKEARHVPSSELMPDRSMCVMSAMSERSSASTNFPQLPRLTALGPCLRRMSLIRRTMPPVKQPNETFFQWRFRCLGSPPPPLEPYGRFAKTSSRSGTGYPSQQGCAKVPHRCTWCH